MPEREKVTADALLKTLSELLVDRIVSSYARASRIDKRRQKSKKTLSLIRDYAEAARRSAYASGYAIAAIDISLQRKKL